MWRALGLCVFVILRVAYAVGSEQGQAGEVTPSASVPGEIGLESDESRLDPDRPHLPEASTAVGKGRVALEGGYTAGDGAVRSQTFPELLLRVGAFADWFEVRAGETFLQTPHAALSRTIARGAGDLYVGVKLAFATTHGVVPAIAIIPQMSVPTGSAAVTARRVLPGVNVDASWDVVNERDSIEVVVANNRIVDNASRPSLETATGITNAVQITRSVEAFGEWDGFSDYVPHRSRYNVVGGLGVFVTKNAAVDFRLGAGLNAASDPLIFGVGFALRR